MALPTAYLTSMKNLAGILDSIKTAQAPEKFTIKFLTTLEYKSNTDRLIIGVLKSLAFLGDDGRPTKRYYDYLDQTQSGVILAEGIREAYADLFAVNKDAQKLSREDVKNKFKTLSQGQYSEAVLDKMSSTFKGLVKLADFKTKRAVAPKDSIVKETDESSVKEPDIAVAGQIPSSMKIDGLVYNIQLVLPESRDPKVYDALFASLRKHLS